MHWPGQNFGENTMEIAKLKNGTEEAKHLIQMVMLSLQTLMQENPIALYEVVMKARDSKHEFFGNTSEILRKLKLIQSDGSLHDSIRNIVNSAAQGDGLDLCLVSPYA